MVQTFMEIRKNESNYQPPLTLASGGWYTDQLKEMSVADKHEHVMQLLEYFRKWLYKERSHGK